MAYLTVTEYKTLSLLPTGYIDEVAAIAIASPGDWLTAQLNYWSGFIDSRLRKRYPEVPFTSPYPYAVQGWLARLLDKVVQLKRGVDPTDAEMQLIVDQFNAALGEIKEAADGNEGLFDLPKHSNDTGTAISRAPTLSYTEQSPYTASYRQRDNSEGEIP